MQPLPHHYSVSAASEKDTYIQTSADHLAGITVAPPAEFGGPGDQWSPEDLLISAVASCFISTFKAIANISKLEWQSISCNVVGKLDKVDRKIKFTEINTHAKLQLSNEIDRDKAEKILQKAEDNCLISNSLSAEVHLSVEITTS